MSRGRWVLVALACCSIVMAGTSPSLARKANKNAPVFAAPVELPQFDGGEPSLAIDPSGNGSVYVTAPQRLSGQPGVGFWASHDHGRTFPISSRIGSSFGGEDSDVEVGLDHSVYVADLEVPANAICRSDDGGQTFIDAGVGNVSCTGIVTSQYGYMSDREWLSRGPHGEMYLSYHDIHAELPYVLRSDDRGKTFTPCGIHAMNLAGDEYKSFTPGPTSGTQVPKPVIAPDGRIYVLYATTSLGASGFNHLWISSSPGCTPASTFTSHLIFGGAGASLAHPFDAITMDAGGTLYAVACGKRSANDTLDNIWLFRSSDGGVTWSEPIRVNTPQLTANMLPAIAGGLRKGEVAVGWYGTTQSTDRQDPANRWRYTIATSFDGGSHFTQNSASGVVHKGPQARALLDFSSIQVEPHSGAVIAAFAGDATGKRHAYVSRQIGGRFLR